MRAAALGPLAAGAEVRQVVEVVGAAEPPEDSVPAAPAPVDAVCLVPADRQLDSPDADPPCNVRMRAQRKSCEREKIRSARRRRMAIPDTARALHNHGGRYQPRLTCIKLPCRQHT